MEFNDFCNEIRDNIGEYLLGYDFDNIQLQEVTHNNNTTHMGLLISRSEVNVAPTIYMEQYYKQYQDTGDMDADFILCHPVPAKFCFVRITMKWIQRCCSVQQWK